MYSLSKIQCFEQCPLKYKFTYIDKIKTIPNSALSKGSKVHYIFENLDNIDYFKNTQDESVLKALNVAYNFLDSELGKRHKEEIIGAKKEFRFGIKKSNNSLVPCDYYDPNVLFHGIIDLLKDNHILDYKTGKAKTYEEQDWTQLSWYSIWLFLNSNYEEIKITYLYVEHNKENSKIIKRSELKNLMLDLVKRIIPVKNFEAMPNEEHKNSPLCDWCTCNHACPFYHENAFKNIPLIKL